MLIRKRLALFAIGVSMLGCKNSMLYKDQIMNPGPVTIFQVASQPTGPADRQDGIQYKMGFRVIETDTFAADKSDGLRKAMLSANNYAAKDSRRCVFTPSYYLQLDSALGFLLAKEPCSKMMFTHDGKDTIIDLVNDNSVEKVVAEMLRNER